MFTKQIRRGSAWLLTAGLMFGGATIASADRDDTSRQQSQQKQQSMQTVDGRVVAMKSVNIKGTDEQHLVALVRTDAGKQKLVDLGPRNDARSLQLDIGDQLSARGRQIDFRGRTLLIAKQARTPDNMLSIDRSMPQQRASKSGKSMCPPEA